MGGGQMPRYWDGRIATRDSDCGMVGDELGEDTNIDESGEDTGIDEKMAEISEVNAQQQAAWASELRGGEYASYVSNNHLNIITKTSVRVQADQCSGGMISFKRFCLFVVLCCLSVKDADRSASNPLSLLPSLSTFAVVSTQTQFRTLLFCEEAGEEPDTDNTLRWC